MITRKDKTAISFNLESATTTQKQCQQKLPLQQLKVQQSPKKTNKNYYYKTTPTTTGEITTIATKS